MQQSLDRLALDSPVIQRIAVGSVFHLLSQHETYKTKAGAAAIQQCLGSTSSVRFCEAMRSILLYITRHKAHKARSRRSLYTRQLSSFASLSRGQARPMSVGLCYPFMLMYHCTRQFLRSCKAQG
jgi:hypothetical protein